MVTDKNGIRNGDGRGGGGLAPLRSSLAEMTGQVLHPDPGNS